MVNVFLFVPSSHFWQLHISWKIITVIIFHFSLFIKPCGGTFNVSRGKIKSPTYSFTEYHHYMNCSYHINVGNNKIVALKYVSQKQFLVNHNNCFGGRGCLIKNKLFFLNKSNLLVVFYNYGKTVMIVEPISKKQSYSGSFHKTINFISLRL